MDIKAFSASLQGKQKLYIVWLDYCREKRDQGTFLAATGDMIECTYCKEWYHDCCRKVPKKYFTNEALDYFCQKYVK